MNKYISILTAAICALSPNYRLYAEEPQTSLPSKLLGTTPDAGGGASAVTAWDIAKITNYNNVKSFGAVGDGVADDTVAIQAAIDNTSSDTIFLPKGTYKITSALRLRSDITIRGDGRDKTIIQQSNATANGFEYVGGGGAHRCTFENFQVSGKGSAISSGWAFRMRSSLSEYYLRHRWTNVLVEDFGGAYDVEKSVLTTWINCQCYRVGKGWLLDQVDTPLLFGCGINGEVNQAEYGLKAINRTLSGNIVGGEWGGTRRALDFEGGYWSVTGSNIETNTKDGVIRIAGEDTKVQCRNIKILCGEAEAADIAIVLIEATSSTLPVHLVWENGKIQGVSGAQGSWRSFVIRGNFYYYPRIIINQRQGHAATVYLESALRGIQQGSYKAALPFPTWNHSLQTSVGNTESGNKSRRGFLQQFATWREESGYHDDLVYFYKHNNDKHYQTSLANDTLTMVWRSPHDEIGTVAGNETTFVENDFLPYSLRNDGETIKCVTHGEFGATMNNKTIKVSFGDSNYIKNVTHRDKQFILTASITRRSRLSSVIIVKLEVDGEFVSIEKLENTQSNTHGTRTFKVTSLGVEDSDVKVHHSRLTWNRAQSNLHQTP